MLLDQYDRVANYLRIGVTDRCNLRCRYCMPAEGIDFAKRSDLLSFEEIVRLVKIFASLGVNKVRLTGGEPFVRNDIQDLISKIIELVPNLYITTNATLLHQHLPFLKEVKLSGLNISLDSLSSEKNAMITRRNDFDVVMNNIQLCLNHGVAVKLNIVVMKGINDNEINDFVAFGQKHKIEVRFIESMPFNDDDGNVGKFLSAADILDIIASKYPEIALANGSQNSSANQYQLGSQSIGIIPSYSRSLCGSCNRIRLTPKGEMLTCLYAKKGTNLLNMIRSGYEDKDISLAIESTASKKLASGVDEEKLRNESVFNSMTTIGG